MIESETLHFTKWQGVLKHLMDQENAVTTEEKCDYWECCTIIYWHAFWHVFPVSRLSSFLLPPKDMRVAELSTLNYSKCVCKMPCNWLASHPECIPASPVVPGRGPGSYVTLQINEMIVLLS